jgi:hypothetical protein
LEALTPKIFMMVENLTTPKSPLLTSSTTHQFTKEGDIPPQKEDAQQQRPEGSVKIKNMPEDNTSISIKESHGLVGEMIKIIFF